MDGDALEESSIMVHRPPQPSPTLQPYLHSWGLWVVASRPIAIVTFVPAPGVNALKVIYESMWVDGKGWKSQPQGYVRHMDEDTIMIGLRYKNVPDEEIRHVKFKWSVSSNLGRWDTFGTTWEGRQVRIYNGDVGVIKDLKDFISSSVERR